MASRQTGGRSHGPERDTGKERFWREMLRRWRRDGGTVREFCAEHGLAEASFYGWRRTIAERDRQASVEPGTGDLPTFVPLRVTPTPPASALEVVVGQGHIIRVTPGFDAATLRSLLTVLAEVPAC